MVEPVFPSVPRERGMYESFYLRAVSPSEPVGAWIRYTVHKRPSAAPRGSLWCTVFDAAAGGALADATARGPLADATAEGLLADATVGGPFMHKHSSEQLSVPAGGWIAVDGDSHMGPGVAQGHCGPASWSLRFSGAEPELRHLGSEWLYRAPLPRTKLTSPLPAASFQGAIELPGRTIELDGWRGMVGHNWGSEHAERWIWVHGIGFEEDPSAWIDVALARVRVGGRTTPWLASGAISVGGRRTALGGLGARGVRAVESVQRCSLVLPGRGGLRVEAHLDVPPHSSAGWRYADPDGGEHDVVNCSVSALTLSVRPRGQAGAILHTPFGGAYELGMREHDHGIPLAPFPDG